MSNKRDTKASWLYPAVAALLGGIVLSLAACGGGSVAVTPRPVNLAGAVDCTGSASKVAGSFIDPALEAVKATGRLAGSVVHLDVISGNTQADTTWAVSESFRPKQRLLTDELIRRDLNRQASRAAKRVAPALARACRNPGRSRGGSDVLGSALVAARELSATTRPGAMPAFLMSSDGRHNRPGDWLDLTNPGREVTPAKVIRRLRSEGRLPVFPRGTKVVAVGIGRGDSVNSTQAARIEAIWKVIFEASGATVEYIGPRFPEAGFGA